MTDKKKTIFDWIDSRKAIFDWIDDCPEECFSYIDEDNTLVVEIKLDEQQND